MFHDSWLKCMDLQSLGTIGVMSVALILLTGTDSWFLLKWRPGNNISLHEYLFQAAVVSRWVCPDDGSPKWFSMANNQWLSSWISSNQWGIWGSIHFFHQISTRVFCCCGVQFLLEGREGIFPRKFAMVLETTHRRMRWSRWRKGLGISDDRWGKCWPSRFRPSTKDPQKPMERWRCFKPPQK